MTCGPKASSLGSTTTSAQGVEQKAGLDQQSSDPSGNLAAHHARKLPEQAGPPANTAASDHGYHMEDATRISQATSTLNCDSNTAAPKPCPAPGLQHAPAVDNGTSMQTSTTVLAVGQLHGAVNDGHRGPVWLIQAGPRVGQAYAPYAGHWQPAPSSTAAAMFMQGDAYIPMVHSHSADVNRNSAPAVIAVSHQAMPGITYLQTNAWPTGHTLPGSAPIPLGRSISSALDSQPLPPAVVQPSPASSAAVQQHVVGLIPQHVGLSISPTPSSRHDTSPRAQINKTGVRPQGFTGVDQVRSPGLPAPLSTQPAAHTPAHPLNILQQHAKQLPDPGMHLDGAAQEPGSGSVSTDGTPVSASHSMEQRASTSGNTGTFRRASSISGRPSNKPEAARPGPTSVHVSGKAVKAQRMGHGIQNTSSSFLGVTWYKASKRWQARLCFDNKKHHLGYFLNEEEAARAYDRAVLQFKSPDAPRNFPDSYDPTAPGTTAPVSAGHASRQLRPLANTGPSSMPLLPQTASLEVVMQGQPLQVHRSNSAPVGMLSSPCGSSLAAPVDPHPGRLSSLPGNTLLAGMDVDQDLPSCPEDQPLEHSNLHLGHWTNEGIVMHHTGLGNLRGAPHLGTVHQDSVIGMENARALSNENIDTGSRQGAVDPAKSPDVLMTAAAEETMSPAAGPGSSIAAVMATQAQLLFAREFVFVWDGTQLAASTSLQGPQQ